MVFAELLIPESCEEYKKNKENPASEYIRPRNCSGFKKIQGATIEGCVYCYNRKEDGKYIHEFERERDGVG